MNEFRVKLMDAYIDNFNTGIKATEHAIQKVIEDKYNVECWWEVCRVGIYKLLLDGCTPTEIADTIIMSCK